MVEALYRLGHPGRRHLGESVSNEQNWPATNTHDALNKYNAFAAKVAALEWALTKKDESDEYGPQPTHPCLFGCNHPSHGAPNVLAEEKRRAGLLESGIVVDDLLAYGKGDEMVYVPAGLLKAAVEAIADAWEEGLAASGVAQAFAPDQLVNPYREPTR